MLIHLPDPGAAIAEMLRVTKPGGLVAVAWSEADTRRLYLAGGGAEHDFAAHFACALASCEKVVRGLDDATYHGVGGGAFYLVAGRKSA